MLDMHEADHSATLARMDRRGRIVAWVVLAAVLVVVAVLFFVIGFAPNANASGGCGGG